PPSSISGAGGIATPSAVLSGSVWDDVDGDGARPVAGVAGESGGTIPVSVDEAPAVGVIVSLIDASGSLVAMTETDEAGLFRFSGLPAGEFAVQLGTQPAATPDGEAVHALAAGEQVTVDEVMVAPERRTELIPDARPLATAQADARPGWLPADSGEVALLCVFVAALLLCGVIVFSSQRRRVLA
ncbi:MAG: SdrD B-like domain, partial [Actinomycetota bacterium]